MTVAEAMRQLVVEETERGVTRGETSAEDSDGTTRRA